MSKILDFRKFLSSFTYLLTYLLTYLRCDILHSSHSRTIPMQRFIMEQKFAWYILPMVLGRQYKQRQSFKFGKQE
ncbi:MAG: hypothetical protein DWQ10_15485 [Calditrichaeota bacterium]|nr:MAG: hypothetical protein DWQ10_15485 [Calditrichota bacterium]